MREIIIGQLFTAPNNNSIMYPTQPKDPLIQVYKYILCNHPKFKDRPFDWVRYTRNVDLNFIAWRAISEHAESAKNQRVNDHRSNSMKGQVTQKS